VDKLGATVECVSPYSQGSAAIDFHCATTEEFEAAARGALDYLERAGFINLNPGLK
jgi:hypothetical protein